MAGCTLSVNSSISFLEHLKHVAGIKASSFGASGSLQRLGIVATDFAALSDH